MKLEELKQYDGKDGRPAYVVYKGDIYDVSGSKLWKNGSHVNRHFAGEDLSHQMSVAPHSDEVMSRFKKVGKLEIEEKSAENDRMDKLRDFYRKFHPHPVFIHFPMALIFFSCLMEAFFLIFNISSFENAAYYSLFVGALFAYPATFSGVFSWWINYQRLLTRTFKIKLYMSIVLLIATSAALIIRIAVPEIAYESGVGFIIYNSLLFSSMPVVFIVGYFGGKITWPG